MPAALLALELRPREWLTRALLLYMALRVLPICGIKLGDVSFAPPTIRALVKGAKVQLIGRWAHDDAPGRAGRAGVNPRGSSRRPSAAPTSSRTMIYPLVTDKDEGRRRSLDRTCR